jgi:integrase
MKKSTKLPDTSNTALEQNNSSSLATGYVLRDYIKAATSDNTRNAYRSGIKQFEKWGGRLPSDQVTISKYLIERATKLNTRTLELHLTAISQWHKTQGLIDPVNTPLIKKTFSGIKRIHGKPKVKAKALRLEHISTMLTYLLDLPDSNKKSRDIALLLINFYGAFRRSELVAIQYSDLVWEPEGLIIYINRSKTDQEGEGINRVIPYGEQPVCAVSALKTWIHKANITSGAIFKPINRWDHIKNKSINPGAINEFLKKLAKSCDYDFASELSSHSFRRGLSTSAARENIDFELIKKQGGWKGDSTVREYIEEGQQFENNTTIVLMKKMYELLNR